MKILNPYEMVLSFNIMQVWK